MTEAPSSAANDFLRDIIDDDLAHGRHDGRVATRFPPEPNGYIHIGHAKSVCLNFGLAAQYRGTCNLRLDDTDPLGESLEYVESIKNDVHWLGFDWQDRIFFASDYFEKLYAFAVALIRKGKAYVCDLSPDEMREYRGSFTEPGKDSPWRNRSVEENLDLFARMRAGEFPDGAKVLRAKIDMTAANIVLRDPIMYRIKREPHYRTGDEWIIYPMYDFAHCLSDALEGITHSICTLEFENNRPLYDWFVNELIEGDKPRQYEFARLSVSYTVLSKRRLIELVQQRHVEGWDDPRMPTVAGLRRRGVPAEAIRSFCSAIGVAKNDNLVDVGLLEHCIRENLNAKAPRAMAVLRPLRVVISNYPDDKVEQITCANHPQVPELGTRKVPFSKVLYIERDDFMEDPPKKYKRLAPGKEVRLRNAYVIRHEETVRDSATGDIVEVRCVCDTDTLDAAPADGRKVDGVIHWVSVAHAVPVDVRLYDRLFSVANPSAEEDYLACLNPASLEVLTCAFVEAGLVSAEPGSRYQFERLGYFCADREPGSSGRKVFNRIVPLRDTWGKMAEK